METVVIGLAGVLVASIGMVAGAVLMRELIRHGHAGFPSKRIDFHGYFDRPREFGTGIAGQDLRQGDPVSWTRGADWTPRIPDPDRRTKDYMDLLAFHGRHKSKCPFYAADKDRAACTCGYVVAEDRWREHNQPGAPAPSVQTDLTRVYASMDLGVDKGFLEKAMKDPSTQEAIRAIMKKHVEKVGEEMAQEAGLGPVEEAVQDGLVMHRIDPLTDEDFATLKAGGTIRRTAHQKPEPGGEEVAYIVLDEALPDVDWTALDRLLEGQPKPFWTTGLHGGFQIGGKVGEEIEITDYTHKGVTFHPARPNGFKALATVRHDTPVEWSLDPRSLRRWPGEGRDMTPHPPTPPRGKQDWVRDAQQGHDYLRRLHDMTGFTGTAPTYNPGEKPSFRYPADRNTDYLAARLEGIRAWDREHNNPPSAYPLEPDIARSDWWTDLTGWVRRHNPFK